MNPSRAERLSKFRQTMKSRGLDAWIARIVDPHLSEYVPEHWQSIKWLTGFTGSAAHLCITAHSAALMVDSRYWEQAASELAGTPFELVKIGAPARLYRRPGLSSHLSLGRRVGLAPELWSEADVRRMRSSLAEDELKLALVPDLFDDVWFEDRPARPQTAVAQLTPGLDGVREKLARVRAVLCDRACEALCLYTLDDIAWLTECRASDIEFNPVFLAGMIVTDSEALLYTEAARFTADALNALTAAGIEVRPPEAMTADLGNYSKELVFMVDPERFPASLFSLLELAPVETLSPVTLMKSRKSEQELEGHPPGHGLRRHGPCASSIRFSTSDSHRAMLSQNPTSPTCLTPSEASAPRQPRVELRHDLRLRLQRSPSALRSEAENSRCPHGGSSSP